MPPGGQVAPGGVVGVLGYGISIGYGKQFNHINIGTLVLSIYDPAAKQLVWIGAAQHAIDPTRSRTRTRKI